MRFPLVLTWEQGRTNGGFTSLAQKPWHNGSFR
jgi:hypothetical protein